MSAALPITHWHDDTGAAIRLDGAAVAAEVRADVAARVARAKQRGVTPSLAVVKVTGDPASDVYVGMKRRTSEALGLRSIAVDLPGDVEEARLVDEVAALSEREDVHGILVQLPLPGGLRPERVLDALAPHKDVDGLHVVNAGLLAQGRAGFVPCTPAGVMHLLRRYEVPLAGRRAVVIGRSILVGKPMAQLLLGADATVTIAHSKTPEVAALCRQAEVVVAAAGRPELVRGGWIAPGAAVVDVGIHRREGGLVGDVAASEVAAVAGWLSPVPKGVGPMTVAMLMQNAVLAAERALAATTASPPSPPAPASSRRP